MSTPPPPPSSSAPSGAEAAAAASASASSAAASTPTPSTTPNSTPAANTTASASKPAAPANPLGTPGYKPKPPAEPLTGWKAAFEHTGIPRSVLNAKPRLPSRNWCIFLGIVGSISYLYYDDRKRAKQIRQEYIDKVKYLSEQTMQGSLDLPRKVKVYGARWPEDDESDRALRYFRKYVKVSTESCRVCSLRAW